jgi:hypothetical protein
MIICRIEIFIFFILFIKDLFALLCIRHSAQNGGGHESRDVNSPPQLDEKQIIYNKNDYNNDSKDCRCDSCGDIYRS